MTHICLSIPPVVSKKHDELSASSHATAMCVIHFGHFWSGSAMIKAFTRPRELNA